MAGQTADLWRRVTGWRAAEHRERLVRAQEGPMDPDAALDAAIELYDLFPAAVDTIDVTRARDVADARAAWRKLRTRLACPPADATHR